MNLNIYTPRSIDGYQLCHPKEQLDFETINVEIVGQPVSKTWHSINMELIKYDEGNVLMQSDSPWLGSHALIFNNHAISGLKTLLEKYGELLPINCSEESLMLYNPLHVINALDEQNSSILRFTNGRIMRVNRYEFVAASIQNIDIFKLANLRVSPTFVSERFVEMWTNANLTGLEFEKVWCPH